MKIASVNLFRKLRDEQQVSVMYITHDLATAHYISDRIAIMLRGFIVESGPVEAVLDRPLHPYTQLLKKSVPEPAPEQRALWARPIVLGTTEVKEYGRIGCRFAGRCPHVMDICRKADPPDVETDGRTVKCYLYQSRPADQL
jgi:peptide/nickel transport system ATP-binding protein